MALTKNFKDTVYARVKSDPDFGIALLTEAMNSFIEGELEDGKLLLRDYINATIGFDALAQNIGLSSKSLMRMLSVNGNPSSKNLFNIISQVQKLTGIQIFVNSSLLDFAA